MGSDRAFLDYVAEQAGLGARLRRQKMFGEYALYLDEKLVALVCDDSVFVKATTALQRFPELPRRPPYPVAKPWPVADELLDDGEAWRNLLLATAAELPLPAPKKPRRSGKKRPAAGA